MTTSADITVDAPVATATATHSGERQGLKGRLLKGGGWLAAAEGAGLALRFFRSIIIARLLTPADFGVAATFAMTVTFLELLSDLGMDKLLVQSEADDPNRLQGTSQLLAFNRGLLMAVAIVLFAGPISVMFSTPGATSAYRWLALVPLLRGLAHQDLVRLQRELKFGRLVLAQMAAAVIGTIVVWPLAAGLRSYWALLWMQVLDAGLLLIFGHMLALHKYRWAYDRAAARRLLHFGWPLLLNGVLIFAAQQGDRVVVGIKYDMHDLGVYAVAFTLAVLPVQVCLRMASMLALPMLSRAQQDPVRFTRLFRTCQQALVLFSGISAVGLILVGPWLVVFVYGRKYEGAAAMIGWVGVMQTLRLIRVGPNLATMALGDSRNALIGNIGRSVAVPLAFAAAVWGASLVWVAVAGSLGELIAIGVATASMRRRHGTPMSIVTRPLGMYLLTVTAAGLAVFAGTAALGALAVLPAAALLCLLFIGGMVTLFDELRESIVVPALRRLPINLKQPAA